jgi:AcrR family transcriptional regulator
MARSTLSGPDRAADVVPPAADGRQLRRRRNRDAVVEALLDLYQEGVLQPSTEAIAARAGLSPRSLFRYFEDVDDLTATAMRRQQARIRHLVPVGVDPDQPTAVKIGALVEQRFRLFDALGTAAVAARIRAPFHPPLAELVRQNRAFLRSQIERLFAPELATLPTDRAAGVLAAADVLTTFEAHRQLLDDLRLDPPRARAVLNQALLTLLGA